VIRERAGFVAAVKSLLSYHQQLGIQRYPRIDSIESFLDRASRSQTKSVLDQVPALRPKVEPSRVAEPAKSPVTPVEIAEEVAACHACELHMKRIYPVAGRGADRVRLLIVGDWLALEADGSHEAGHLFGVEQDLMLSRMLAAIQLPPEDVFVTNVIKCAIPSTEQPQASHVESCVSYLRRQILALMPEIICTMGMIAARALLERRQPLSRLRGIFHDYEVAGKVKIPVLTTYHPTYLLQNPEMKQATWADLQLLAKRLGLMQRT
jgi:uracil-DNA glycosylase family 4